MSDHGALQALAAANPVASGIPAPGDDALLEHVLARQRTPRRRRRKTVIAVGICLLTLGATAAYAAFGGQDAARVDASLKQAALDARPLTATALAAIDRSNAADGTLYACLKAQGAPTDAPNGLNPSPAAKAACAAEEAAASAVHRDPAVRAAFAAEADLIGAAWYCVQKQGYEVNGNRITSDPAPEELTAIWAAFARCEAKVGVPPEHRAKRP